MEDMKPWFDYTNEMQESGAHLGGEPLQPSVTATTVRNRDGETLTTDGPFAETKEVLGGFYMVDVDDLDAALEWSAKCPGATGGTMEVRPVAEFDMPE